MKCVDPNDAMNQLAANQLLDEAFLHLSHVTRKAIKPVYGLLTTLQLTLAKSKTTIGKARKGFDFLGYRIGAGSPDSVRVSQTSIQRFQIRLQRLYEPRASNTRVATYVKHWRRWATSGLGDLNVEMPGVFERIRYFDLVV